MTECYYFTTLSAANGFADQSNSLHTSFYFTARWALYCSATAVAERRQEKLLPLSFPENHQTDSGARKSLFPQSHRADVVLVFHSDVEAYLTSSDMISSEV